MRKPLVCSVVLCLLSCGPKKDEPPPEVRVWTVSATDLYRSYLDGSERWTGETIRVRLVRGSYSVFSGVIHWHARDPAEGPSIVFAYPVPVPDADKTVEVVGVCRGRILDGRRRAGGANWHVRVEVSHLEGR